MTRPVRRLLFLGLAAAGLWTLRRVLVERAERTARRQEWTSNAPPELRGVSAPRSLPEAPVLRELDALRPSVSEQRATLHPVGRDATKVAPAPAPSPIPAPAAVPAPAPTIAEPEPEPSSAGPVVAAIDDAAAADTGVADTRVDNAHLDQVRQRLASIRVDVPGGRETPPKAEQGAAARPRRSRRVDRWQEPMADGACNDSHPIKVKLRSGLFHLPGSFAYDRARADRCYHSSADAEADGFHRAKR